MRLRGAGKLDLRGYRPVSLDKTIEWLQATTFDGSEVQSAFSVPWEWKDTSLDVRLWMAAELNDGAAATRLVEAGADINSGNDAMQTALHKAAMMGHRNIYCLGTLVALGADLFAKDSRNRTAVDYARESFETGFGPEDAVDLLEQAMAVVGGKKNSRKKNETVEDAAQEEEELPPRDMLMVPTGSGKFVPIAPELVAIEDEDKEDAKTPQADVDGGGKGEKSGEVEKKKKKKKRKYGSAKERWRSLNIQKKRRAARMRGEEV